MPSLGKKMPPVEPFPNGCPTCGKAWVFKTSGALAVIGGTLRHEHPPGPCIRPVVQCEPDDDPSTYRPRSVLQRGGNSPVLLHRVCALSSCGKPFDTYAPAKKCCSDPCRKAKRRQCNRAAWRRCWQRRKVA